MQGTHICDVHEYVEDAHTCDCEECRPFILKVVSMMAARSISTNLFPGVINLAHYIIRLIKASESKQNRQKAIRKSVCVLCWIAEGVVCLEVFRASCRFLAGCCKDARITDKACYNDDEEHEDFDKAEKIHEIYAASAPKGVENTRKRDDSDGNASYNKIVISTDWFA